MTMRKITYKQAIAEAHMEEMSRDTNIILLGTELKLGSSLGQSEGVYEKFGDDRIWEMPISESGYVGTAVGMAYGGIPTIVEVQFADFFSYAFDAVVNQAAKMRYLSNGQECVPVVFRAPQGMGFFFGAHHSQCAEPWFMNVPGLKIVLPSTPYDAKGLLKTAIRDHDPVLYLEHKGLMFDKGEVPEEEYTIPFGQARVARAGTDVTVVAFQNMVPFSLSAAEELAKEGISVEVVDPRTLVPLDKESIAASVNKTGRAVVAHEHPLRGGAGGEISAVIMERCFHNLKAPVQRVGGANIPIPFGTLDRFVFPHKKDIIAAIRNTLG